MLQILNTLSTALLMLMVLLLSVTATKNNEDKEARLQALNNVSDSLVSLFISLSIFVATIALLAFILRSS